MQLLVVDDEADIRDFLADVLRRKGGYVVDVCSGGWEALAKVKAAPGVYALVLTDVRMLKGDGIELLEALQTTLPPRPAVALISGYDVGSAEVLDRGAVSLLAKPILSEELLAAVAAALTPAAIRWAAPPSWYGEVPVLALRFPSMTVALAAGDLVFGRGGCFVAATSGDLPEAGELLRFRLEFGDEPAIEGAGLCRWARSDAHHTFGQGFGLEFLYLEPAALATVLEQVKRLDPRAHVPLGHIDL